MSTTTDPDKIDGTPLPGRRIALSDLPRRLSIRLAWLTTFLVMIAEIVVFVPSVAYFWKDALRDKLETVAVASFATGRAHTGDLEPLSPAEQDELLRALGAEVISVKAGNADRLVAKAGTVGTVDTTVDVFEGSTIETIAQAFGTLTAQTPRTLRIVGPIGDGSMKGELIVRDAALRDAMLIYARNLLLISLAIASFVGIVVNLAINWQLLRPVRNMTRSMIGFAQDPEDPSRILSPSGRDDEIGMAEAELERMQKTLAETLRRQRHLADLGLAVAKINHDLRNTLASAQLVSDRLMDLPDPQVQRFAPTLIRSLDRALTYTQSVLAYGRAVEEQPVRRRTRLFELVSDVFGAEEHHGRGEVELRNAVPTNLEIDVDPDQFHRALANLTRNALEALAEHDEAAMPPTVTVTAATRANGSVRILVEDTGPGLPARAREGLFQAFRGSARAGGTGLGLAIVDEIVRAHRGRILLAEADRPGARFEILLPEGTARSGSGTV